MLVFFLSEFGFCEGKLASNGIFYSASDYYKQLFGCKVYKVSVDAGCTCPNRDGSKGQGGCSFCNSSGSGDFASQRGESIPVQLEKGKLLVKSKNNAGKYLAYFQNFTNTYGDQNLLIEKFKAALNVKDVVGLVIATRPDCIEEEFIRKIGKICQNSYLSIELGFQTSKKSSVENINRCYENEELEKAIRIIKKCCSDCHVTVHVIFGLPDESVDDMLNSLRYVLDAGANGVKIALLHVLKGTKFEKDFCDGKFRCMDMEEYFMVLARAISIIPSRIVVHRLTGDGAKKNLVAPLWTADKKKVYNSMIKYFRDNGVVQGSLQ